MIYNSWVTYTSVYTDSEPGRVFWGADEELSDGGSPRVIVYGYQSVTPHQDGNASESLSEAWTRFKDLVQKVPHHGIDLWLQVQIFYDMSIFATRHAIDHSVGGKLRDKSAKESWELIENLALYDHESWNDPRDLAKPVKAISLP
ncbi:hypothetical protein Tco_0746681 [Tanacetum coccineum]